MITPVSVAKIFPSILPNGSLIIAAQVDFPEIEVRQRLTVSREYGVGEIYIPEGSNFVGKTILETQLQEQDVNVLTLYRGAKVIPNPRKDRVLEPEDKLLCFGRMEVMRGMVPAKTHKCRRPKVIDLPESVSGHQSSSDET